MAQEGGRYRPARRAHLRDLDRQGRRRNPITRSRHALRDQSAGRRNGNNQHDRSDHRRRRRQIVSSRCTVPAATPASSPVTAPPPVTSAAAGDRVRSSPLVRKIAKDNNVDLSQVQAPEPPAALPRPTSSAIWNRVQSPSRQRQRLPQPPPLHRRRSLQPRSHSRRTRPMTKMRSIIAQRMVESKRTSPHVHTVFKVDMTRIVKLREKEKSKYEAAQRRQAPYMPFITRAAIVALRKHPVVNGSRRGDRHPLQQEHQHRHRRCARLGPHRPGLEADRRKELPGHRPRHR